MEGCYNAPQLAVLVTLAICFTIVMCGVVFKWDRSQETTKSIDVTVLDSALNFPLMPVQVMSLKPTDILVFQAKAILSNDDWKRLEAIVSAWVKKVNLTVQVLVIDSETNISIIERHRDEP